MQKNFKSLLNKILRKEKTQAFIAYLAYLYIQFVYKTCSWRFKNNGIIDSYISKNKPLIIAFWHGHLLMMTCAWQRPTPFNMLISNHRDGKFISKISKIFGISVINGSTERQGYAAARQIIAKLKQGQVIGITPDGPRGPREQISDGVLQLACLTNADIIPVAYSCTNMRILGTWDHFRLALPFGKGIFVMGKPITPVQDLEQLRITLQKAMETVVIEADQSFNK
jgi:lysophospholipid acyltransferase (LPLAT)-like uncharacterized protein